jgi:hypothetical protein
LALSDAAGGSNSLRRERLEHSGVIFIVENADAKSVREVLVIFSPQFEAPQISSPASKTTNEKFKVLRAYSGGGKRQPHAIRSGQGAAQDE